MATLCDCGERMVKGGACRLTHAAGNDGVRKPRKVYEGGWSSETPDVCGDCYVKIGAPHHMGCDVERCAFCARQAIGCDHAHAYEELARGA